MGADVAETAADDALGLGSVAAADASALGCLGLAVPPMTPTFLSGGEFATWQTNALVLALIATFLIDFSGRGSNKTSSRRTIAIMAAVVAAVLEIWLIAVFYKNKPTSGYWFLFFALLVVLAIFIYLAVVASFGN